MIGLRYDAGMDERQKTPFWLIALITFLTVEFGATMIGSIVGVGFMHGRIRGIEGGVIWAAIAFCAAVPIALVAGVVAYLKSK